MTASVKISLPAYRARNIEAEMNVQAMYLGLVPQSVRAAKNRYM